MQVTVKDTILWLTGWSMPAAVFDRLRDLLSDFQHVYVDYSGASSSEKILQLAEEEAQKAMSLNRGSLLIAGWSLGGLLALRMASLGMADGLVLIASTAKFTRSRGQKDLGWADGYVRGMIAGLGENRKLVEMKFRRLGFAKDVEAAMCPYPSSGSWTTPALLAGLEVLRSVDCLNILPEIDIPVLIVHGTDDAICPYAAAEEMLGLLPQANLLPISGGEHAPFLGREDDLAEKIRSWWHDQQKNRNRTSI